MSEGDRNGHPDGCPCLDWQCQVYQGRARIRAQESEIARLRAALEAVGCRRIHVSAVVKLVPPDECCVVCRALSPAQQADTGAPPTGEGTSE